MADYNSRLFEQVMDKLSGSDHDDGRSPVGSEVEDIYIDFENVLSSFGEPLIANDIFKQIGNLSFLYSRIVHPILSELIDACKDEPERLSNIYIDDDIANTLVERLEHRIWMVRSTMSNRNADDVLDADICRLCVVLIEELAPHLAKIASDARHRVSPHSDVPAELTITERASSELIPNVRDPNLLLVQIEYCWVYQ